MNKIETSIAISFAFIILELNFATYFFTSVKVLPDKINIRLNTSISSGILSYTVHKIVASILGRI